MACAASYSLFIQRRVNPMWMLLSRIFDIIMSWKKRRKLAKDHPYHHYREADFFGLKWRWQWELEFTQSETPTWMMVNLRAGCPKCGVFPPSMILPSIVDRSIKWALCPSCKKRTDIDTWDLDECKLPVDSLLAAAKDAIFLSMGNGSWQIPDDISERDLRELRAGE